MTNILLLSVGTRNKIIQYFKHTLNGKGLVVATDMSELAPALYEADKHYIVPRMTDPNYINQILEICEKEKISGILSLIDPELSLLAANREAFSKIGVTVIGSSYELCERALDKMQMFTWMKDHNFLCAKSYVSKDLFFSDVEADKIKYPVFVKPVRGSASIAVSKVYDAETIDLLFLHTQDLMIQEYLDGQEIGADVYVDMISGEVLSIFTKKKLLMRAGETDKAISFKSKKLFIEIENFVREGGWKGQIDIDIFDINGQYYFSEVNPRFGGGYPHAYECGVNFMKYIITNLTGTKCIPDVGNYDENVIMMKYSEIMMH